MHLPDMLAPARVHEATGGGRLAFALALAGGLTGPVLWLRDARARGTLYAPGLAAFIDPGRVVMARPTGPLAMLQALEDCLRSGAAPLTVAELAEAPGLTPSRRLQLAAGAGGGRGLCLIPEDRLCTNAAETRWRAEPMPGTEAAQLWEILKDKRGRTGRWEGTPDQPRLRPDRGRDSDGLTRPRRQHRPGASRAVRAFLERRP